METLPTFGTFTTENPNKNIYTTQTFTQQFGPTGVLMLDTECLYFLDA